MKILIAADMEGITGVVSWDQVNPEHAEYNRFRKLMTNDVNAAIRGAFAAGADEIVVTDGHAMGYNILIEELDPRATLNSGMSATLAMVQGVENHVDGVLFVGYHARAGTPNAILDHTWSGSRVAGLSLKSAAQSEYQPFGEIGLNAALCGQFDVPVLMVSGDSAACDEAATLLSGIETAVVKWASGRMSAECLTPEESQQKIQQAAYQSITHLVASQDAGGSLRPLRLEAPISLAVDFLKSEMADGAALMPGSHRNGRRIEYTADDILTVFHAFCAILALAK